MELPTASATTWRRSTHSYLTTSVVEGMGVTLQRTAYSTSIKIRRDHTRAIFDTDLRHIAQHVIAYQTSGR